MSTEPTRRKLLFHIGHHKTGSTSIQYAFATGKVQLEHGKILYPGKLTHNYLRGHFDTYAAEGKFIPGSPGFPNLERISSLLKAGDFEIAVISGEAFEWANPGSTYRVLRDLMLPYVDDYSVLCYIRPHAERIVSGFSESLKIGSFKGSLETFSRNAMRDGRLAFASHLAAWAKKFGDRLIVRPVVRSELTAGSVLQDFVTYGFGPNISAKIESEPLANKSLCLEELLLLRMIHGQVAEKNGQLRLALGWEISETISEIEGATKSRTKLMLHKSLAEEIRSCYLSDAQEIDRLYFQGRNIFRAALDSSVDTAISEPQSLEPSDYFDAETLYIAKILSAQISALLKNSGEPWQKYLQKRRVSRLHRGLKEPG